MYKVSIIVPVYNAERYLHKCLDSLVNQTLEDIEIIAVNDGSTDGSLAILEEYQAKYPKKIKVFSKENGGQASARNLALKYVQGEYIGCVDADDYTDIDMFRLMYEEAVSANRCDIIACDSYTVRGKEKEYVRFGDYPDVLRLFIDAWVSPCNKIIRSEIYEKSGVIFPEGYIYEDTAWFAELIPWIKAIGNVHLPLYYRMVNENSTMTAAQGKRTAQIFPVMNGVLDFYREHGLYDKYRNELEYFYIRILFLSSLKRISAIDDKELRNKYVEKTILEVKEHFPDYKKNPYLKGCRGVYIKFTNKWVLKAWVCALRMKKRKPVQNNSR